MSDNGTFYEDDEPMEDIRAAWREGERGVTKGDRDLNRRAKSIVDRAVERLDGREAVVTEVTVVSSGTTDVETVDYYDPFIDRVDDSNLTEPLEYQVG